MVALVLEVIYGAGDLKAHVYVRRTEGADESPNALIGHGVAHEVEVKVARGPPPVARHLLHHHAALHRHVVGHARCRDQREHHVAAGARRGVLEVKPVVDVDVSNLTEVHLYSTSLCIMSKRLSARL